MHTLSKYFSVILSRCSRLQSVLKSVTSSDLFDKCRTSKIAHRAFVSRIAKMIGEHNMRNIVATAWL